MKYFFRSSSSAVSSPVKSILPLSNPAANSSHPTMPGTNGISKSSESHLQKRAEKPFILPSSPINISVP
jgi:hypothetical protein